MGKLIYAAICSLDGFIEDDQGKFDWAEPAEDVHTHINQLEAQNGTLILGRRLYEIMKFWESEEAMQALPMYIKDYGRIWRKAEKIVYSRTLHEVASLRTTIRQNFDPEEIRLLKATSKGNIGIGGAELAGVAMSHSLVDEVYLFVNPVVVGAGKPAFAWEPQTRMSLLETKSFASGVVMLRYGLSDPGISKPDR